MTTDVYSYTGAFATFVVPGGVTALVVDAYGAAGGTGNDVAIAGGLGGRVQCELTVTPGETLRIYVGGAGQKSQLSATAAGGFNGGGSGNGTGGSFGGGGGGGASDIRRAPYALADRLVIAPGGGGGGFHYVGGGGGTPTGLNGANATYGGKGGTSIAGGAGGGGSPSGLPGSLGTGGNAKTNSFAGGGGGGLYGGGSGGGTSGNRGGGGGGSGLSTGISSTTTDAIRAGDGEISLTYTALSVGIAFAASIGFSIDPRTVVRIRRVPRREYLWVSGLDGIQRGVIR